MDEWAPDPLVPELSEMERAELDAVPVVAGRNSAKPRLVSSGKTVVNLTSLNFAGLAGDERVERRAIETLRRCGLGSCGPTGFYGTYGTSNPNLSFCLNESSFAFMIIMGE